MAGDSDAATEQEASPFWDSLTNDDPTPEELRTLDRLRDALREHGGAVASAHTYSSEHDLRASISVWVHEGIVWGHIVRAPPRTEDPDGATALVLHRLEGR